VPFTLYAYGQARTSAEVAGAFVNLEPLVGVALGAVAFGDPFGTLSLVGAGAILSGIALSTLVPTVPTGHSRRNGLP
jgi:drug/metabolite transporter (DMT)-like permease